MSRDDLLRIDGKITDIAGSGNYQIQLDSGVLITARLSGRMKRFKIRIIVGDRVTVAVSPYDPSHGLVVHRHKEGQRGFLEHGS